GLEEADSKYYFVVWGYNAAGCVATSVAETTVRTVPARITDVGGSMVPTNDGAVWDYRVEDVVTAPGGHFEIRGIDANNEPLTGWSTFTTPGIPSAVIGRSFGETVRFEIKNCRNEYVLCSDPWVVQAPEPTISLAPS